MLLGSCCCILVAYRPSNMLLHQRHAGLSQGQVAYRPSNMLLHQRHAGLSQGQVAYRPSNMLVYLRDRLVIVPATCWSISGTGWLSSQQHAGLSQGQVGYRPSNMLVYLRDRSAHGNSMCCHTETEDADQTCYLTQSQHTDTRPTIPSTDPITPAAWQGRHQSNNS